MFDSFLLAFTALFSIVNPIAMALIFSQVTAERSPKERAQLATLVAVYSAIVMLTALWAGSYDFTPAPFILVPQPTPIRLTSVISL